MTEIRTIATTTHGRYLVVPASREPNEPAPLLVGVHGYAEDATAHLERLISIPGIERWTVASIQALHRFYRGRSTSVVASWMTSQDRDLMIQDNMAYVSAVVEAICGDHHSDPLVFAGFSQGAAMAYRAATLGIRAQAVIAIGGDVPPELGPDALGRVPMALLGRGRRDDWYNADKLNADAARLSAAGVEVTRVELDAGHEWTSEFSAAAGQFLARLT